MNWADLERGGWTAEVLAHWRRLGQFRKAHPAVGTGEHRVVQASPYVFSRTLEAGNLRDRVVVAMGQGTGAKTVPVGGVFADGVTLRDWYSGATGTVQNGAVTLTTGHGLLLLGEAR
jgi:alpha-amylase